MTVDGCGNLFDGAWLHHLPSQRSDPDHRRADRTRSHVRSLRSRSSDIPRLGRLELRTRPLAANRWPVSPPRRPLGGEGRGGEVFSRDASDLSLIARAPLRVHPSR